MKLKKGCAVLIDILKKRSGFTLIETGIVIMIAGGTMLTGAQFVKIYTESVKHSRTIKNLELTEDALGEYFGLKGYYPCPADPSLSPGDANYGISQCRDSTDPTYDKDTCIGTPLGGITCTNTQSRDADSNGHRDIVMIGAIPFRDLSNMAADSEKGAPYIEANRVDGYGTLISYAVTESMSLANKGNNLITPASPTTGAIRVVDENKIDITIPPKTAHYIILSHGLDGMGGYSAAGRLIQNCFVPSATDPTGPAVEPPAPGLHGTLGKIETENCDNNDAIFLQGILSLADNNNYNDDYLYYKARGLRNLWKRSFASPNGESYIYNTNPGNVGVETPIPTSKLHIMGDMSAKASLIAPEYCDPSDTSCLDPDFLGGTAVPECPADQVAYAIGENKIECRDVEWTIPAKGCLVIDEDGNPLTTGDIKPSFMQGFSNLGNLYCCTKLGVCEKQ